MYLDKGIITKRLTIIKKDYKLKNIFFDLTAYHELSIPNEYKTKYSTNMQVNFIAKHTTFTRCILDIITDYTVDDYDLLLIGIFNIEYVEEHYYIYYAVINNPKEE